MGDTDTAKGTAPRPAQGQRENRRAVDNDIAVALVMNGGVSLAVWIGGVAAEVYRACRRDGVDALHANVTVDVITGASAGGLNGVFLAAALSRDLPVEVFDGLRDVWLQAGSFAELLRDPLDANPPSLLKGDEFFRKEIERVLLTWFAGRRARALAPFDLVMTATTLNPAPAPFTDDLDSTFVEPKPRARFHFTADTLCPSDPAGDIVLARQLALAARTSASFPGAFEPSFVNVGGTFPDRVDMAGIASFSSPMWAVDGGVLVNKPVRPALDVLNARGSTRARRVMFYVNPDPGGGPTVPPASPDDVPVILDVVRRSVVDLPQMESISNDLDEIRLHNARAGGALRMRETLFLGVAIRREDGSTGDADVDLDDLGEKLYPLWLKREGFDTATRRVGRRLAAGGGTRSSPVASLDLKQRVTLSWNSFERGLIGARGDADFFAGVLPSGSDGEDYGPTGRWRWGSYPLLFAADAVLDLCARANRAAGEATDASVTDAALAFVLATINTKADEIASISSDLRDLDAALEDYWDDALARMPSYLTAGGDTVDPPADVGYEYADTVAAKGYERWPTPPPDVAAAINPGAQGTTSMPDPRRLRTWRRALAVLGTTVGLPDAKPADMTVANVHRGHAVLAGRLATAAAALRQPLTDVSSAKPTSTGARLTAAILPRDLGPATWLRHLTAAAVVHYMTTPHEATTPIDFVLVSANTPCPLDPSRIDATDKVNGLQLGHFGGFLKESWRANDWMWGRLDGAARLVASLLDPQRLRQVYPTSTAAMTSLTPMLPADTTADDQRCIAQELAYLDNNGATRPPRLTTLETCLITEIQRRIAVEELPNVAAAVRRSTEDGGTLTPAARAFLDKVATPITPVTAAAVLQACSIGRETVVSERRSDLLAATATKAAAVFGTAMQGRQSGIPIIRPLLGSVRTALLTAYLFVLNAVRRDKVAVALTTLILAAAGALLTASLLGANVPVVLMVVAVSLALTWAALVTLTVGAWKALVPIGVAVAIVALSAIDKSQAQEMFDPTLGRHWKHVLQVAGLVLAFAIGAVGTWFYRRRCKKLANKPPDPVTTQRLARYDRVINGLPETDLIRARLVEARDELDRRRGEPLDRAKRGRNWSLPIALAFAGLYALAIELTMLHWHLDWVSTWFDWANRWRAAVIIGTLTALTIALNIVRSVTRRVRLP
jgi:patatin-related protein